MRSLVLALLLVGCSGGSGGGGGGADGGSSDGGETDGGASDGGADPTCPDVVVLEAPGPAVAAGALDALVLEVVGGDLASLSLSDADSAGASMSGTLTAAIDGPTVTFDDLLAEGVGSLVISVGGCPEIGPLVELLVGATLQTEPTFLPAARLGQDYAAALPAEVARTDEPPPGLEVDGAFVLGAPTETGAFLFEATAWGAGDVLRRLLVHLPVLPADDADLPAPAFAPSEDGPYDVDVVELSIDTIATGNGTLRDVAVRVAYPSDGAGGVADGPFAAVAFHHAAHSPATIYDDYTDLHGRLASHGLIVASVDATDAISGTSQSWENLHDLSTVQLATVELLRGQPAELGGQVDPDRIFVSGHSRGGAASLISLWRDPALSGAVCFEPVSPIQTPYQDWSDPDANGDRPYPVRPILIFAGSRDLDEPWPLVDTAYEQTVGPTVFVTIMGANHEDTYDDGTPGGLTSTSTIPVDARHDIDQHFTVSFLSRFGAVGEPSGDLGFDAALFGTDALSSDLSDEGVAVHGRRYVASQLDIDDFSGDDGENLFGGTNTSEALDESANDEPYPEGLAAAWRSGDVIAVIGDWAISRHLAWSDPEAELTLALAADGGPVDLTSFSTLALRVQRDCPPPGSGACPRRDVDFDVVLRDADGAELAVPVSEGMGELGIIGRHWQSSLLPLDEFPGVDLSRVSEVALRFDAVGIDDGDLWVDDLRFE